MKKLLLLAIMAIAFTGTSQTISTEAPSVSASAITVPKNGLQIESTFSFSEEKAYAPLKNYAFLLPSTVVRFGLTEKLELRATGSFQVNTYTNPPTRFSANNLGLGLKYELLNKEGGKTQMAIIGHFNFYNYAWRNKSTNLTYTLSHSFTDKHSIGFNLGSTYAFSKIESSKIKSIIISSSLIYNYQLSKKFCLFGELFGSISKSTLLITDQDITLTSTFTESIGADFGLLYLLRDNIQLDIAGGFNFDMNWYFTSLGFNILLNSKK